MKQKAAWVCGVWVYVCVCGGDKYGYFARLFSVFLVISEGGNKMPILLSVLFMGEWGLYRVHYYQGWGEVIFEL